VRILSKHTSHKLSCPTAFSDWKTPFFAPSFRESVHRVCRPLWRVHSQGLATLSMNA
jgi:hypothetical protein